MRADRGECWPTGAKTKDVAFAGDAVTHRSGPSASIVALDR
ncbi:MAG: hypothetical protein ACXWUG_06915 [Polyangiales bacterium]